MSKKAISDLFRRWATQGRRAATASPRPRTRLGVEQFEDRVVPATLPEPTVASTRTVPNTGSGFQPQIVFDPTNANTLAMVVAEANGILAQVSFDGGTSWVKIRDTNSSGTASVPATAAGDPSRGKLLDPSRPINNFPETRAYTNVSAPTIAFSRSGTIYISYLEHNVDKTSGALVVESFGYNRNTRLITQNDLDPNDYYRRANGSNNMANVLYQWVDSAGTFNRTLNPYIAVDNNLPSYTDPVTGVTTPVDTMVDNGVFVAWNDSAATPTVNGSNTFAGSPLSYTPNVVYLAASRDGGVNFSTPVPVSDDGHIQSSSKLPVIAGGTAPQIVFSPGEINPDSTVTPGVMSIVWQSTVSNRVVQSASQPDGGTGAPVVSTVTVRTPTNSNAGPIRDAFTNQTGPDTPATSTFTQTVTLPGSFTSLSDLDVSVALTHPDVADISIVLVAPNGTRIRLVDNRTRADGTDKPASINGVVPGLRHTNDLGTAAGIVLGVVGNAVGTVFSDEAARQIHDPSNLAPYIGSFRPDYTGGMAQTSLTALYGLTATDLDGVWSLEITDFRNDRPADGAPVPAQFLQFWSLHFTSQLDNSDVGGRVGADRVVAAGVNPVASVPATSLTFPNAVSTVSNAAPTGATPGDQTYTTLTPVSPTFGVGPGVSIAYDASLGSYSPYSGRMYMAYTGGGGSDTDIFLIASDDNGATWFRPDGGTGRVNDDSLFDNFTEGNRQQYMPTVAVDPTTGTVVVMWYDARNDASNARAATYIATSIDGGATFSTQTYLNAEKTAVDQVSRQTVVLEPVPSNLAGITQYGTGIRQSLLAYGGQIKPFWTGNANGTGSSIFTATVRTAAGPRIVYGASGSVVADDGNTNATFAADGTRQIDGFLIEFDRPVDASTFTVADVTVLFRGPSTDRNAAIPPTQIDVAEIIPLDPDFRDNSAVYTTHAPSATRFYVRFLNPQSSVGTYTYAVGPAVFDRIPSLVTATYSSLTTPTNIPDGGQIESAIKVPVLPGNPDVTARDLGAVGNIRVAVNITHPDDGDLTLTLIGPDGREVILSDQNEIDEDGNLDGNDYTNTVFEDGATPITAGTTPFNGVFAPEELLALFATVNPATGVPTPLAGNWRLRVEDDRDSVGTPNQRLLGWSISFTGADGNVLTFEFDGNGMDQDADSFTAEANEDVFSNPRSTNGVPFTLDFDPATLPLILPGPQLVDTSVPTNPTATDNLILNGTATQIDLTFDRELNPTSFTVGNILRMSGPLGPIDLSTGVTVVPVPGTVNPLTGGSKQFRVTFPGQTMSGSYTIEFGPDSFGRSVRGVDRFQFTTILPAATTTIPVTFSEAPAGGLALSDVLRITGPTGDVTTANGITGSGTTYQITFSSALPAGQYVVEFKDPTVLNPANPAAAKRLQVAGSGPAMDMDVDAGLDVLRGKSSDSSAVVARTFTSSGPVPIPPGTATGTGVVPSVAILPLEVTEDFVIQSSTLQQIQLLMNVSHPNVRDLDIDLVSPSGVTVRLFTGELLVASAVNKTANFTNTRLIDRVNDPNVAPLLSAEAPFNAGETGFFSPQTPLSALLGTGSKGTWQLKVTNHGTNPVTSDPLSTDPAQILNWSLTLPKSVPGTGLGEAVADRFSASFRVFTQNPSNPLSQQVWTSVGTAPTNETANSTRISVTAVDPSDPTGNTVYVGVAGGGIWKTTDFLTTDPNGPHYVPLTDLGPNLAVNVSSIALFPRNGDPNQTVVFALTGEGDALTREPGRFTASGVGVLRSMDGGRTWQVLDSTNNLNGSGSISLMSDSSRDHAFVGLSGFKIVVDPNLSVDNKIIAYMAVSGAAGSANQGVWRTVDGGDTWQLVQAGQATDVVLSAGSANTTNPVTGRTVFNGNLQQLFAAFKGSGVYWTNSALTAVSMAQRSGGFGNPLIRLYNTATGTVGNAVAVNAPADTPSGSKGRISLAAPALTGNPLKDSYLKDWLYALVTGADDAMNGLYLTKDAGLNWTKVQIPKTATTTVSATGFGTNDESKADLDLFTTEGAPQGDYDIAMTVSPLNPNILYIAGFGFKSIRLDLTTVRDAKQFVINNNSDPGVVAGGPTVQPGGVVGAAAVVQGGEVSNQYADNFLNLSRDYNTPFNTNSLIRVTGTGPASFTNDGADIRWSPFNDFLSVDNLPDSGSSDRAQNRLVAGNIHSIVPVIDPLTGQARFLYSTDSGIFTGVDAGDGSLTGGIGYNELTTFNRNGNLNATQFWDGAVQPSQFAADLAGAMFYGQADKNGFTVSDPNVLTNGNLNWRGPLGNGIAVAVDALGSGTSFQWRAPNTPGFDGNTTATGFDFFRVFSNQVDPAFSGGVGRTTGLIVGDTENPGLSIGQWSNLTGYPFAVNPFNPNAILIASVQAPGPVIYRTLNQGVQWNAVPSPVPLGGTTVPALAFGASNPAQPTLTNNFFYAGTASGRVFVTTTGGTSWTEISTGLDGTSLVRIVPNPAVGAKDVFAVTTSGVFYKQDGTSAASPWVNISGNLFNLTRPVFGNSTDLIPALEYLTSIAVDWRFAIPVPGDPSHTFPVLYVGGEGGVFQSKDFGVTWTLYPSIGIDGAPADGGYLPNTHVTDLDLSIGDLDPSTGKYKAGGLNLLTASTYGRGMWAIRLDDALPANSFISGPRVIQVTPVTTTPPAAVSTSSIQVRFSGAVEPSSFTVNDVSVTDPNGTPVQILAINKLTTGTNTTPDPRDLYEIVFATPQTAVGSYHLVVGYNPTAANGVPADTPRITDPSGFRMNQDNDLTNGEPIQDQFSTDVVLNSGIVNSLFVLSSPSTLTAGTSGHVQVEVRKADGTRNTAINGTITLTPGANTGAFTATPTTINIVNGFAEFDVSFQKAGVQTINVFSPSGAINGTSFSTNVTPGAVAGFVFDQPTYSVTAPGTQSFTLTAVDQYGNPTTYAVDPGTPFTGPVSITVAGAAATLPASVTLTNGQATFTGTFNTSGVSQITASAANPNGGAALTGSATVATNAGVATQFVVTASAGPFTAGDAVPVTVQVLDSQGNRASNLNGQSVVVTVSPGGGSPVTSGPLTIVNGVASFTVTLPAAGTYTISATAGGVGGSTGPITVNAAPLPPTPTDKLTGTFAVGTGMGGSPVLQVYNGDGTLNSSYTPFPGGYRGEVDPSSAGFTGGLRVAVGDVTGDSVPDYVVGTGPGITASVKVISGSTGQEVLDYQPFESFTGGVFVTLGDVNKDGVNEIVITPDEGGGPRVVVLNGGNFSRIGNFFGIKDDSFRGGARAAVGDVNGDGYAEIVVSAGFGGGPRISVYDGAAFTQGREVHPVADFFMFEEALRNGAYVSVGDLDGDGFGDILGGAGPGGAPRVLGISGKTLIAPQGGAGAALASPLVNFFAGTIDNRGGIRLTTKNLDGDRFTDLIVGDGEGGGSKVTAYRGAVLMAGNTSSPAFEFDALDGYSGGVFVG